MAQPESSSIPSDSPSSDSPTPSSLESTLRAHFKIQHIAIEDQSGGCGQAFSAVIVSDDFEGKSLLQRNRLVNGILKEEIKGIHAWSCRCLTQKQWGKGQ
jgi:stress-induced morphogen